VGTRSDGIASPRGVVDARDLGVWSIGSAWTLVAAFARTVQAHGDRIAIESDHARLTYAQLDAASSALAAAIAGFGAGPADRVAVARWQRR